MNFKNFIKASILSVSLVGFSNVMLPTRAQAFLLVMGAAGATPEEGPWGENNYYTTALQKFSIVSLCVITLPFCLLDQESGSQGSVSIQELVANGYPESDISMILTDQQQLTQRLAIQRAKLIVTAEDTKSSIAGQIASMYPEVSGAYIDFATASAGLK